MEAEFDISGLKCKIVIVYLEERPVSDFGPFLREEQNLLNGIVNIAVDSIERILVIEKNQHLNAVLRGIRNVNQLITQAHDRFQLVNGSVNNLLESFGYSNALIILTDDHFMPTMVECAGCNATRQKFKTKLIDDKLPDYLLDILNSTETVINDTPDKFPVLHSLVKNYADQGILITRLKYKNKVYGLLCVTTPKLFIRDSEELDLFKEVAGDLAFAINKIEVGQVSISNESFSLNQVLDSLLLTFEALSVKDIREIRITLVKDLEDDKAYILGDSGRIEQVLTNLLSNAFKFTESGTIQFGYKIESKEKIYFFVKDTGIGLTQAEKTVIFERFRQVDSHLTTVHGGTGFGLAISKGLVELMGGEIGVKSVKNKGSEFYFKLPYRTSEKSGEINTVGQLPMTPDWASNSLLIVEDEEDNYLYLKAILEDTKINLLWAKNGIEAISFARENNNIDLVLMDIRLPYIDGLKATKEIKSFKPKLPVIAQTAYAMSSDKVKCMTAGCDDYLTKPINRMVLFSLLNKYLKPK